MNRFLLSAKAERDLDEIFSYLDELPFKPADRIASSLQATLYDIATNPYRGTCHSYATRLVGQEVRSRVLSPYRIFYRFSGQVPEIIAILHTARDVASILAGRFQ